MWEFVTNKSKAMMASASQQLAAILEADWRWELDDNPEFAIQAGALDALGAEIALQDVSPEGYTRRFEHSRAIAADLRALLESSEARALSKSERVVASLVLESHTRMAENSALCPLYLIPLNSIGSTGITHSLLEVLEWLPMQAEKDFKLALAVLRAAPAQLRQFERALRQGVQTGYVASIDVMAGICPALTSLVDQEGLPSEITKPLAAR